MEKRRVVRAYLILSALFNLEIACIVAVYVTFLQSRGLNLFQVNMVNFVFYATRLIAEVPTGVLADLYGRKKCIVGATVLNGLGFALYALAVSTLGCMLSEMVIGLGSALLSGAYSAWLYDEMETPEEQNLARLAMVRSSQIANFIMIVVPPIGGLLASRNMLYPWIAATFVAGVATLVGIITVKETPRIRKERKTQEIWRSGISIGRSDPVMKFIFVLCMLQIGLMQAPNMQWQPFFLEHIKVVWGLGLLKSGIGISLLVGSLLRGWFLRQAGSERQALINCQIGIGASLVITSLSANFTSALSFFLLHEVVRGLFVPLKDVYLNDHVPSKEERATILSVVQMGSHFGGMLGLLMSGLIAIRFGIAFTWGLFGLLLLGGTYFLRKEPVPD